MIIDYFKFIFKHIKKQKLIYFFTFFGIVCAVALFTSMYIISDSLNNQFYYNIPRENEIFIYNNELGQNTISNLKSFNEINKVYGINNEYRLIEFGNEKKIVNIYTFYPQLSNEYFGTDKENLCDDGLIIGNSIGDELFIKKINEYDTIKILNSGEYKVCKVFPKINNQLIDTSIFRANRDYVNNYSKLMIVLYDKKDKEDLIGKLKIMYPNYDILDFDKDNPVSNQVIRLKNMVFIILSTVIVVVFIVSIINLMETLYTFIEQRKNEIGLLEAVGAKEINIFMIFMTETLLISIISTITGIIMGIIVSNIGISLINKSYSMNLFINLDFKIILFIFLISIIVSTLSSLIPAYIASKTNVAETLRNE